MSLFRVVLYGVTGTSLLGLVAMQQGWLKPKPLRAPTPTPSRVPSPAPRPLSSGPRQIVPGGTLPANAALIATTTGRVNLRSGPSTGASVIALLLPGVRLAVMNEADVGEGLLGWTKVSTVSGQSGFVRNDNISFV